LGVILYPVLVVFSSLILSGPLFLMYLGLVLASLGLLIFGQIAGWIDVTTPEPLTPAVFLVYIVIIGCTAWIARLLTDSRRAALQTARERERQIRVLNAALEQRVAERTAELEQANRELESFAYAMAHDLRTPARAMLGMSELLKTELGGRISPEAQHYLKRLQSNAGRTGRMIDEMLNFMRLSRQAIRVEQVDTMGIVRQALTEAGPDPDVDIHLESLPECRADAALLQKVYAHLIDNALKYSRGRSPARIDIGAIIENGQMVYYVRDNGVGFDMQYANKLFGVFQRLHYADEFEGTGVGLAIVRRIVERHGGRVWAQAAANQGATFHFTLNAPPAAVANTDRFLEKQ
jgi:light-regulated signal transduction histidine kinase (bacteriophytochrome)